MKLNQSFNLGFTPTKTDHNSVVVTYNNIGECLSSTTQPMQSDYGTPYVHRVNIHVHVLHKPLRVIIVTLSLYSVEQQWSRGILTFISMTGTKWPCSHFSGT